MYSHNLQQNITLRATRFALHNTRGFSIIELAVTVSLFIIITGIVLVNFPSFSSKIALENLAYEIALVIRQAQVFGIASREFNVGSGIFPSHGAYFNVSQNTTFIFFADANKDGKYSGLSELIETLTLQRGNSISQLCGHSTSTSVCAPLDELNLTFTRPNPEAKITGSAAGSDALYSYATITVRARSGATKIITVWSNGQIAIQ